MLNEFQSHAKVVACTHESLWRWADHISQGISLTEWTSEVLWLRTATAQVRLMHKDRQVAARSTFVDREPLLCLEWAERSARRVAEDLAIESGSSLQVCVWLTIHDTPALRAANLGLPQKAHQFGRAQGRTFRVFPHADLGIRIPNPHAADDGRPWIYPRLQPKPVFEGVVFSLGGHQGEFALTKAALEKDYFDFEDQLDIEQATDTAQERMAA